MRIEGCRAVVTGAAIGLGRAIALVLAEAGAEVLVVDVDEEGGRITVASAPEGRCRFLRADMTVADDVRGMVAAGRPRILVNNAGGGGHIPPHFPEAPAEQWEASLRLNLLGPMLATQAVRHCCIDRSPAILTARSPASRLSRRSGGLRRSARPAIQGPAGGGGTPLYRKISRQDHR
jgi:NAD(P)-dependent dehydrogenase (short-subunit alcohol dehydrogenase family)